MKNLETLIHNKSNSDTIFLKVSQAKQIIDTLNGLSETAARNYLKKMDAESRLQRLKEKLKVGENDVFLQS